MSLTRLFFIFFVTALLIRSIIFIWYIAPYERYKQPDSFDYHFCALSVASGLGMHRYDNHEPYFWRTPGYPAFLAPFYSFFGIEKADFPANSTAQQAALWIQIIISSFIPIIIYLLAFVLTNSSIISSLSAWITIFHPGFVLTSCYLLTEGLALIFFYLFLLFFMRFIFVQNKYVYLLVSIVMLSIYTWMRPMGELVGLTSSFILLLFSSKTWYKNIQYAAFFLILFAATLFPWYLRNYQLTDRWFFCPTIGPYLNCFCAPRILRTVNNVPLEKTLQYTQYCAAVKIREVRTSLPPHKFPSPLLCTHVALPIIKQYPWLFIKDWIREVAKTTFDLYSCQCTGFYNNSFWYDPLEEFITEKTYACLIDQPMPFWVRIIAWIEFLFMILLWAGLFMSFVLLFTKQITKHYQILWIICFMLIGITVGLTGGFGYARLRLPIEPLLYILSLYAWITMLRTKKQGYKK